MGINNAPVSCKAGGAWSKQVDIHWWGIKVLQVTAGKQHFASGQVEIPIHLAAETIIAATHLLFVPQVELYKTILDKHCILLIMQHWHDISQIFHGISRKHCDLKSNVLNCLINEVLPKMTEQTFTNYLKISPLWRTGAKVTHCYFIQNQFKYFWHILRFWTNLRDSSESSLAL